MNRRIVRWAVLVAIGAAFGAFAMSGRADEDSEDGTLHVRAEMLARNNELRAKRGLAPHRENSALMKAAQDHASYMARTRSRSHYSNGGPSGRAARYGFPSGVRENIAWGHTTVPVVFATWYGSSGHYANMMSYTTDAGFGWAIGSDGSPCWVAVYGTPPETPGRWWRPRGGLFGRLLKR